MAAKTKKSEKTEEAIKAPAFSNEKFEATGETKVVFGITLHRIRAKIAIGLIAAGTLGGWIESERNLRVSGDAWVSGDAQVSGNARVYGNAQVSGNARVSGVVLLATRSDGYNFVAVPTPDGPRIIAGCRYFTFADARVHWSATRGGTQLGDESLALVDFLERMATIRGFMEPVVAPAEAVE
jgi:hypothetical protein